MNRLKMLRNKSLPVSVVSPENFYTIEDLSAVKKIRDYIAKPDFPCVGAKAALVQGNVEFRVYRDLADSGSATGLLFDLLTYVQTIDLDDPRIQSFVAIFPETDRVNEEEFETLLFDRLGDLSRESEFLDFGWHEDVSPDPSNPHFSMSIAGHPFFVVGMHPNASRNARRTPFPVLVFNSNLQFDRLKADGRYDKLKAEIRKREIKFNGSINPMLNDHGRSSEARQYSGRKLPKNWSCPMQFKGSGDE